MSDLSREEKIKNLIEVVGLEMDLATTYLEMYGDNLEVIYL